MALDAMGVFMLISSKRQGAAERRPACWQLACRWSVKALRWRGSNVGQGLQRDSAGTDAGDRARAAESLDAIKARRDMYPIPTGYHPSTPYLMHEACAALYRRDPPRRFGCHAQRSRRATSADVGEAVLLRRGCRCRVRAVFERELRAGGTGVAKLAHWFNGDRAGSVKEPCANTIWIAGSVETLSPQELQARAARALQSSAA